MDVSRIGRRGGARAPVGVLLLERFRLFFCQEGLIRQVCRALEGRQRPKIPEALKVGLPSGVRGMAEDGFAGGACASVVSGSNTAANTANTDAGSRDIIVLLFSTNQITVVPMLRMFLILLAGRAQADEHRPGERRSDASSMVRQPRLAAGSSVAATRIR